MRDTWCTQCANENHHRTPLQQLQQPARAPLCTDAPAARKQAPMVAAAQAALLARCARDCPPFPLPPFPPPPYSCHLLLRQVNQAAGVKAADEAASGTNSQWNSSNYHWEERDYSVWAKGRLAELVTGLAVSAKTFNLTATGCSATGEAANAIRKAKKIVTYELGCVVTFSGESGGTDVEGTITLGNIQEDTEPAEYTVAVVCDATERSKKAIAGDMDVMDRVLKRTRTLTKVAEKKLVPQVHTAIAALLEELAAK